MGIVAYALFVMADATAAIPAATDDIYLKTLQAEARARNLARDQVWLRLLHARPGRFGGVESTFDYPDFFRAANGKHDPTAELDATLASFFNDAEIAGEPSQCRYRARYHWLREQLNIDPARLPPQPCARYDEWISALNPGPLAVVFASNDLDSPSSMFGHTLMRVDAADHDSKERLLSYAVNYAADAPANNALTYALKGLTGFYQGYYSVMPYYDKVKQYEGFDHRDLWEYPLRLTPDQRTRMIEHLWELRGVGSDYYFFSENCSYQLLALIEAARPDLKLTDSFEKNIPYAIPIDTVRGLARAGLLEEPIYHPSEARKLQSMYQQLDARQQTWILDYAQAKSDLRASAYTGASDVEKARMLEIEHQYLYLQFQNKNLPRNIGLPLDRAALVARSGIPTASNFQPVSRPDISPDAGHGSARLSLGLRADNSDQAAAEFRIRPAYHDRLDPTGGYMPGGEIEFLDLGLLARQHGVTVADVHLLSVQAIAPRSDTLKPYSWQISTGLRRYGMDAVTADGAGALGAYLDGGPGLAWAPTTSMQAYIFTLASLDANHDLAKDYAFQMGARTGVAVQPNRRLSTQLQMDWLGDVAGGGRPLGILRWDMQLHLDANNGLRAELAYGNDHRRETGALHLLWEHYF